MELTSMLSQEGTFVVLAELTPGPGYNPAPIHQFLKDYQEQGKQSLPEGFDFSGIMIPQNPGGVANLDPTDVLADLAQSDLLEGLAYIPHLSCKDHNRDALFSQLVGYRQRGVRSVLTLTGDKPVSAKGVFQLESVGLLQLIGSLNRDTLLKSKPEQLGHAPLFCAGAAVSPFKYTEPSLMQQYYKMEKKVRAGAGYLVTQVGWDWQKSQELMSYIKESELDIPVIGNVYLLSTTNPAPRLMHDGKLPGCYVSDELLKTLQGESFEQHVERAAQQVAMYRSLGAKGVDIGGVHDFGTFQSILIRAADIGEDWEKSKDNLYFPPKKTFYLYNGTNRQVPLSQPARTLRHRWFDLMHNALFEPGKPGFQAFAKTMGWLGMEKHPDGVAAKGFTAMERVFKYAAFQCQDCGDCYLPENFGFCTMGGCKKGLANSPCGDATVDGMCGNALDKVCRGEQIYQAAAATPDGRQRLREALYAPRNPELQHSSSILNTLFGRDHTMKNALISIGEAVHASIPKTGKVMQELHAMGPDAYEQDSPQLKYMIALIEDQAVEGADYIAINVDAFGETDPQKAIDAMVAYVRLVRQYGRGVPVCIDSSDDNVLIEGLKVWYETDQAVAQPLVNSIKVYTMDAMMPLKEEYDFTFVGLLMSEDKPSGPGGSHSVEELVGLARTLFKKAVSHGFKPEEIFFDSTVFPLAIDMPMQPGVPGYTYRAFETIRQIKSDPEMRGVHCSLGVSNCCRDLPGRKIGICRAYVDRAMAVGLDAGIVNVNHHYGQKPADPKLVAMVEAFAKMDGDPDKTNDAIMLMGQFCSETRK